MNNHEIEESQRDVVNLNLSTEAPRDWTRHCSRPINEGRAPERKKCLAARGS